MPYRCSIFRKLEVYFRTPFIYLEVVIQAISGSIIEMISTWENMKLSILSKYLFIIDILLYYCLKTWYLLAILIDTSMIDINLIDIVTNPRPSSKMILIYLYPFYIIRQSIIQFSNNFIQVLGILVSIVR